jgi:type IV pilus biogenesis protein CpaD/CtpE
VPVLVVLAGCSSSDETTATTTTTIVWTTAPATTLTTTEPPPPDTTKAVPETTVATEGSRAAQRILIDHLDDCGTSNPTDRICNGGVDNATGAAVVVEVGRCLAAEGRPDARSCSRCGTPRRSVCGVPRPTSLTWCFRWDRPSLL